MSKSKAAFVAGGGFVGFLAVMLASSMIGRGLSSGDPIAFGAALLGCLFAIMSAGAMLYGIVASIAHWLKDEHTPEKH